MKLAQSKRTVISAALSWDGARWPIRTLPPKAREFLGQSSGSSAHDAATLFARDHVNEIRVCWVPCLKGGSDVLSEPFQTATGRRLGFKAIKIIRFDDLLGVIYRRGYAGQLQTSAKARR